MQRDCTDGLLFAFPLPLTPVLPTLFEKLVGAAVPRSSDSYPACLLPNSLPFAVLPSVLFMSISASDPVSPFPPLQFDIYGNAFGLLSAHPLVPFISLHHVDLIEPVFPGRNTRDALAHLGKAMRAEPAAFLQQSFCVDAQRR